VSVEAKPCRSCGTPVIFAEHSRTGRHAPLQPDPAGRWTIVWPHYFLASENVPPEHRYTSHFARCPGAAGHRRRPTPTGRSSA
jgi:hypothetical protein